jgi:hypothetical protein
MMNNALYTGFIEFLMRGHILSVPSALTLNISDSVRSFFSHFLNIY